MNHKFVAGSVLVLALVMSSVSGVFAQPTLNETATVCYYDGKAYSAGAKITLQDGTVQTCGKDGTWTLRSVKPPVGPVVPIVPVR